jgi:hypothetical protein
MQGTKEGGGSSSSMWLPFNNGSNAGNDVVLWVPKGDSNRGVLLDDRTTTNINANFNNSNNININIDHSRNLSSRTIITNATTTTSKVAKVDASERYKMIGSFPNPTNPPSKEAVPVESVFGTAVSADGVDWSVRCPFYRLKNSRVWCVCVWC